MKLNICLFMLIALLSCKTDVQRNDGKIEISNDELNRFNEIFSGSFINGEQREFVKGFLLEKPHLDSQRLVIEYLPFVFFELQDESRESYFFSVNYKDCYVSIASEINRFLYPNNSSIYPVDLRFLSDYFPNHYSCSNTDELPYREISFDKHLIGQWKIDSVLNRDKDIEQRFSAIFFEFHDRELLIDDNRYEFYHSGQLIDVPELRLKFFKIHIGREYMILVNFYEDNYQEFYFSKQ
jgi:hypothetical protein